MPSKNPTYQDCTELQSAKFELKSGNPKKALMLFEKAIKKHPTNALILQESCSAFTQQYELRKARSCINRLFRIADPTDPTILFLGAKMSQEAYLPKLALQYLTQASNSQHASARAHIELAYLLRKNNRQNEALEAINKALHQDSENSLAKCLRAEILADTGAHFKAEQIFEILAEDHNTNTQARALHSWAKMLDAQEQFDEAFLKLSLSKQLLADTSLAKSKIHASSKEYSLLDRFIATAKRDHFEKFKSETDLRTNNILLTGNPRSGTTLIEKILDAHSQIISADEYNILTSLTLPLLHNHTATNTLSLTETLKTPLKARKNLGLDYLKKLELAIGEKAQKRHLIDKNPGLTGHIPALLAILPYTKIIYALRHPLDIATSCLFQWLPLNSASVNYLTVKGCLNRIGQELNFWEKLKTILPEGQWTETRYEHTVTNTVSEVSQILNWMGLSWEDNIDDYQTNLRRRGVNSPTFQEVSKPIHQKSKNRWKNYQKHFEPCIGKIEDSISGYGYEGI